MGFFFDAPTRAAIRYFDGPTPEEIYEEEQEEEPRKTFKAWRFLGALAFLGAVFAAGIYCAHDDKLQEWSKVLLHGFEILLGAVIGIVIGEGQN